jgi:hypothetical protein
MSLSHRSSGDVVYTVSSCRWRSTVEVPGGLDELRREHARMLDAHLHKEHPWKFVEFAEPPHGEVRSLVCVLCGALVAESPTHQKWHERAER